MSRTKLNKRIWLLRLTISFAILLLVSFLFIFFRGLAWNPHTIQENTSELELGVTTMLRQSRQRVWVTRLDQLQRQRLQLIDRFVFNEGGCQLQEQVCFIKSETTQQGVLIVYVNEKPDILATEVVWQGGFINPNNGAVYDLLGRLYRGSIKDNNDLVARYINASE